VNSTGQNEITIQFINHIYVKQLVHNVNDLAFIN